MIRVRSVLLAIERGVHLEKREEQIEKRFWGIFRSFQRIPQEFLSPSRSKIASAAIERERGRCLAMKNM